MPLLEHTNLSNAIDEAEQKAKNSKEDISYIVSTCQYGPILSRYKVKRSEET